MQTPLADHHQGPGASAAPIPQGILEDPRGVTRLFNAGRFIAKCYGVQHDFREGTYTHEGGAYQIAWKRWTIDRLVWSHNSSILFLQGVTLLNLCQPYLLLAADLVPVMDPEPGLRNAVLAELVATSSDLTVEQAFMLLAPDARGA